MHCILQEAKSFKFNNPKRNINEQVLHDCIVYTRLYSVSLSLQDCLAKVKISVSEAFVQERGRGRREDRGRKRKKGEREAREPAAL